MKPRFRSIGRMTIACFALIASVALIGCQSTEQTPRTRTTSSSSNNTTVTEPGMVRSSLAYPTGERATSALLVEKVAPAEVQVGAPYSYKIMVTNLTNQALSDVVVTDTTDKNYKFKDSSPSVTNKGGVLTWNVGALAPKATQTLTVNGSAAETGMVQYCATATYSLAACLATKVTEPALKVVKSGPSQVLACDPIPYTIVVTNTGTGAARDIVVTDKLPEGLTGPNGEQTVTVNVGTLAPGASRQIALNAKATKAGKYSNVAEASGAGGLSGKSEKVDTTVVKPVLKVTMTATEKQFAGKDVTYNITVENTGDGVAKNATLTNAMSGNLDVVGATNNAVRNGNNIVWQLGDIAPKGKSSVALTIRPQTLGTLEGVATAKAYCADAATATSKTSILGIPAILLEVVDIDDPVRVGNDETYVITVTNQGSAADTNIKVVAKLEKEMTFVSAEGPTKGTHANGTVTFEPLTTLAAKAKAIWKVKVKANAAGDVRFSVTMSSDEIKRPVNETEATNFYEFFPEK